MPHTLPNTMKAYIIDRRSVIWPLQAAMGGYANHAQLVTRPIPVPAADELLVKLEYFAANPTDHFHLDYVGPAGSMLGWDFAGVVTSTGSAVKIHKVGDRVFGVVHGGKYPTVGSAAEYCTVSDDLVMKVPEGMSAEDAVTLGVGFLTAAVSLYDAQKVPMPPATVANAPWYFVSGGATSVGQFAVQLAHLAGYRVIASASERSFDLVKSYGADHVVSYANHKTALEEIRKITDGGVGLAMDCVGGAANIRFAVDAFGPGGGKLASILMGPKSHRPEVVIEQVLLYRYLGKAFTFIPLIAKFPAEPEKRAFLTRLVSVAPERIVKYGLKPNPTETLKGMEALPASWDRLRKKQVSGKKLVFDFRA